MKWEVITCSNIHKYTFLNFKVDSKLITLSWISSTPAVFETSKHSSTSVSPFKNKKDT